MSSSSGASSRPRSAASGTAAEHEQVAEPVEQIHGESARIVSSLDHAIDRAVHGCRVAGRESVDHVVEQRDIRDPEQTDGPCVGDPGGPGPGDELIEQRKRVPRRAATTPNDQGQHTRLDIDALRRADALQVRAQHTGRDEPKRVMVGPGPDRWKHAVRLGSREDEHQEIGRFLDELEQGIETLRRHHVRLVDDVDLVAVPNRGVEGPFPQVARVVDATVAGRVDLDHVDRACPVRGQLDARLAHAARRGRWALDAIQRAGQDAGAGRLAAASRTREQVGVIDPAGVERLHQRGGYMILPDDLGEGGGPVLAI